MTLDEIDKILISNQGRCCAYRGESEGTIYIPIENWGELKAEIYEHFEEMIPKKENPESADVHRGYNLCREDFLKNFRKSKGEKFCVTCRKWTTDCEEVGVYDWQTLRINICKECRDKNKEAR